MIGFRGYDKLSVVVFSYVVECSEKNAVFNISLLLGSKYDHAFCPNFSVVEVVSVLAGKAIIDTFLSVSLSRYVE